MSRRVQISNIALDGDKAFAGALGMSGEEFDTQVFQLHGFSSNPREAAESVVIENNGDHDNYIALPPEGPRLADEGSTVVYYGDTEIILSENAVRISVGGNFLNIEDGLLSTDLNIQTSGNIIGDVVRTASGVDLGTHRHLGVQTGGGTSGGPA